MPPIISYQDLFDFEGYRKSINDLEAANQQFAQSTEGVLKRTKEQYEQLAKTLKEIQAGLKGIDITQKGAIDELLKVDKVISETTKDVTGLANATKGLESITSMTAVSVNDLTGWMRKLEKEARAVDVSTEEGKQTFKEYADNIRSTSTASQKFTQQLKDAKRGVDAAEGSYFKLQQETAELAKRLKSLPGAFDAATGAINKNNKEAVQLQKQISQNNAALKSYDAQLGQHFRNVGNYPQITSAFTSSISALSTSLLGLAGVTSVFGFLTDSVNEFIEADEKAARLRNTLDNLGKVDAFERLAQKAADFQKAFRFIDNDEIIGVFDQLITYGKLTENQIDQLTPVIIDFASKARISLGESTSVVIKAIEGNGRALKEYGINIKDAKTVSEAFGIVMTELKPRVEGAAAAFGETFAGQLKTTKQEINDLKEQIGEQFQPVILGTLRVLKQGIEGIGQFFQFAGDQFDRFFNPVAFEARKRGEEIIQERKSREERIKSIVEDFSKQSKEQQDKSQKASLLTFRTIQEEFVKAGKEGNTKRLKELKTQLQDEAKIFSEFERVRKEATEKNTLLGLGGNMTIKETKDKKEKTTKEETIEQRIRRQQEAVTKLAELEIEQNKLLHEQKIINEAEFQNRKLDITKQYIDAVINLEKSLGEKSDITRITDFQIKAVKAEQEYTKFQQEEIEKRKKLQEDELKSAVDIRKKQLLQIGLEKNKAFEDAFKAEIDAEKKAFDLIREGRNTSLKEEIAYLNRLKDIKVSYAQDTAEEEYQIKALYAERDRELRQQIETTAIEILNTGLDIIQESQNARFEQRIQKLEQEKQIELAAAGNNAAAREAIEKRFAQQINAEKKKQAQSEKRFALFRIAIDTASAVVKTISQFGMPFAIPFIALAVAQGALQAGLVAAQPLPAFKHGTQSAPEGYAVVDEEGPELIQRPTGKVELSKNKGPRLTYLEKGTKVFTAPRTKEILKEIKSNEVIENNKLHNRLITDFTKGKMIEQSVIMSNAFESSGFNQAALESAFAGAVSNIRVNEWRVKNGELVQAIQDKTSTKTYLNNKYSL